MALPPGLPVVDHHCHLSTAGEGVGAARRFRSAGGTHLFLATQNYSGRLPRSLDDYREQFATTEELARRVQEETGVVVYPVIAPYPVDLVEATAALGSEPALALHRAALDLAGRWVRERRAVALGEVGWPHFEVPEGILETAQAAFEHAVSVAREADCPLVVHSPDLDAAGYGKLSVLALRLGLRPERMVKHYARERVAPGDRASVTPSYLARRPLVRAVLDDPAPWFLETDFLDDPARPGAVLDLTTVPRRATMLASEPGERAERLWIPFATSVERVYGVRPEVPG